MKINLSSKFKKDLKRYKHNTAKVRALGIFIAHLSSSGTVPASYDPHKLHGVYKGCMECHIENDFLLIWIDESTDTIKLLRLGTHHELFGN
jgi:mRNA interferase YafQ